LDLYLDDELGAVKLKSSELPPPDAMWGQYWYRSGTNASMTKALGEIVTEVTDRIKWKTGDVWLDIACNDGTLLRQVPDTFTKIGIDPCNDEYYAESSKHAKVIQDYFNREAYDRATDQKAKVISCIAMFYDLDRPDQFIKDMDYALAEDGIIVLQLSYTPLMLEQMAFDNICHEHVYYHSLSSIALLFSRHGYTVIDANVNDVNGGSIRIYLARDKADPSIFGTQQLRQVCMYRTDALMDVEENTFDIANPLIWDTFADRLDKLKSDVVEFIRAERKKGKTIYGYGASTKGNTLLQYFGLTKDDITAIAERSPYKFGLKTVGTEIPIVSEEEMRAAKPDYLLVLPWHFIDEFEQREAAYLDAGGALIVPCPDFKVIRR
jgi:hypothetical protein